METLTPHDAYYKRLFNHPEMVRHLLLSFVPGIDKQTLNFNTLARAGESTTAEDLRARYGDRVWKIKIGRTRQDLYVHLEIQSSPDSWMARRMHEYVGGVWSTAQNEREGALAGQTARRRPPKLPPVLPLVLYTGRRKWRSRLDVADLLGPSLPFMANLRPTQRYMLIEQTAWLPKIQLGPEPNFAAAIFLLQHALSWSEMLPVYNQLRTWFASRPSSQLERDIAAFLSWLLRINYGDTTIQDQDDLEGIEKVVQAHEDLWWQRWKAEGIAEGKARQAHDSLVAGLERRFGTLSEATMQRLGSASEEQLAAWLMRLIDGASSLDEVFAENGAAGTAES